MNTDAILSSSFQLNKEYKLNRNEKTFNIDDFREKMIVKYADLHNSYQSIFNISINDTYNYNRLSSMLNYAEKVRSGEMTEHNASVAVGQILVDQIVKPQINKQT